MTSVFLSQEPNNGLNQSQQLLINLAMKQAFHVLQLPQMELVEWLKNEIESNPVLEIDLAKEPLEQEKNPAFQHRDKTQEKIDQRRKEHQESLLTASVSLYEHLMQQAPLAFESREEIHLAELIIGHLNHKGYLETELDAIAPHVSTQKMEKILAVIQSLDPPGVGAKNLPECLLLQLRLKNKQGSLAYAIIAKHYDDLLHNRLPLIAKQLQIPVAEVSRIVKEQIAPLDLHPGYRYYSQPTTAIIPDLFFLCWESEWKVEINASHIPSFHIAGAYVNALGDPELKKNEAFYLRRQIVAGKWLKRIVGKRAQTIRGIGEWILKRQKAFFDGEQKGLTPMTMQDAADELGIHESTVARAVSNKYVSCPQGMFALKSFFSQGLKTAHGKKISNHSLREMLSTMIEKEDRLSPLSDEQIALKFRKLGISCARRTVAKYRAMLEISPAHLRKKW